MTLDNLVKVTFFLSDRKYIAEYRRVRQEVLAGSKIALTTIITGIFDEAVAARDRRRSPRPDRDSTLRGTIEP